MAKVGLGLGVLEGMIVNGGISIGVGDGEIAEVAANLGVAGCFGAVIAAPGDFEIAGPSNLVSTVSSRPDSGLAPVVEHPRAAMNKITPTNPVRTMNLDESNMMPFGTASRGEPTLMKP